MENASKALIVAGAILIAILLISVGVMVFNSTGGVTKNLQSKMSEQEIKSFNNKFTTYEGKNVRGTSVKSLLQTVYINNKEEESDELKVTVVATTKDTSNRQPYGANGATLEDGPASAWVNTGKTYEVECGYSDNLIVNTISIEEK